MIEEALKSRKNTFTKFIMIALFAMIVASMGIFGAFDRSQAPVDIMAEVNDGFITRAQLANAVRQMENSNPQKTENDFQRKMMEQQVLNQLVLRSLMLKTAQQENYTATDREVVDTLAQIPAFQDQGRFSKAKYIELLQANKINPAGFEKERREEIMMNKLNGLFTLALERPSILSDFDSKIQNIKTNADFIEIHALPVSNTDKDVVEYANNEANKDALQKYFNTHQSEFLSQESFRLRQILIKTSGTDEKGLASAATKAKEIRDSLTPENFESKAKMASEDIVTKERGGDMGTVTPEQIDPSIVQSVRSLKPNEISSPIRTATGFHIVQLVEKKSAETPSFDSAKNSIAAKLLSEKKLEDTMKRSQELLSKGNTEELETFLKSNGYTWKTTGSFSLESENIPQVGAVAEFSRVAFALNKDHPWAKELVKNDKRAFVIRHNSNVEAAPSSNDQLAQYLAQFMNRKRVGDVYQSWIEESKKNGNLKMYHENEGASPAMVQ